MERTTKETKEVELVDEPFLVSYLTGTSPRLGHPVYLRKRVYYGVSQDSSYPLRFDDMHLTEQQVDKLISLLQEIKKEWE